jgi:hypothetical protein
MDKLLKNRKNIVELGILPLSYYLWEQDKYN